jgi:hypothetical protein
MKAQSAVSTVKSRVASVKLTPEQYALIEQRAEQCGVRTGAWMRSILVQAATNKAKKGGVRVREPIRGIV